MPPSRNARLHELDSALLVLRRFWQRPEIRHILATRLDQTTNIEDYRTLRTIEQSPAPLSVGEIAHRLEIDASTGSRLIDGLVRRGFVVRQVAADRRRTTVALSELGRTSLSTLVQARIDCLGEVSAGWPVNEIGELARLLRRLDDSAATLVSADSVAASSAQPAHLDEGRPA
jgi:DNA-binding MarR family transcriptional regulator